MTDRLAIVTHYWAPHVGGVETMAREQADGVAAAGLNVEVFTSRLAGDDGKHVGGRYPVHRYRCVNWQEEHLNIPVPAMSPRMLRDLVRFGREPAGTFVAHGHAYVGSLYAAVAARMTGRPLIVVQSSPFVSYPRPVQLLEHAVDRTAGRWVLEQARTVICISRYVESYVRKIAPLARTAVIHPGVDTDRFTLRPLPADSAPESPLRVLTLRRLVPRNGVRVLVEAWRQARLGNGAELLIGGTGPQLAQLRLLAAAHPTIEFLGRVPDDDLAAVYQSADLVVVPTVSGEGFGLVAAEALACGVPVVATDGGATPELVRDGVDGLIVPAGDPRALAAALRRLATEPGLLAQMTLAARDRHAGLGWESSLASLREVVGEPADLSQPGAGIPWPAPAPQG